MSDAAPPVIFDCPACRGRMLVRLVHEGQDVPCPHCRRPVRVPVGAIGAAPPPPKRHDPLQSRAVLSQWLAIVGGLGLLGFGCPVFFLFGIFGTAAAILGWGVVREARRRGERPPSEATLALVLGCIETALLLLLLGFLLILVILAKV